MNYLKLSGLALLFLMESLPGLTQEGVLINEPDSDKPVLFAHLPDKIPVDINDLKSLFRIEAAKGTVVPVSFLNNKLTGFNGKIVSTINKYNNTLRSVVIRLTMFNGATLTLSSSTATDGAARFSGRIISFQHGDLFVLQKENEHYFFIKKKFHELVNE